MMFVTPAYGQEAAPAEGEAHTEVAHGAGEKVPFPPFDATHFPSQLLWLAITFGLFFLFLKGVVMPRLQGILDVRSDRIAQDVEQATRMKAEADASVAAYEQELATARANAGKIGQAARDSSREAADAERKRVEAELEAKLTAAEVRIASIKSAAMNEVGSIAEETAATIVRELVGGTVDKAALAAAVKSARG